MNLKRKRKSSFILTIVWLLILPLALSCGVTQTETYWFENEKGDINTNDLPRLQKLVPFDIVVPSYLPDEDNHNETRYNLTSSNLADTVYELFIFEYFSDNYSKSFTISEQKIPVDTTINIVDIPETENDSIISYNGVEIWEEGFEIRKFYRYTWLHNNVWYSAWFDGYTRDESRATIKSMLD